MTLTDVIQMNTNIFLVKNYISAINTLYTGSHEDIQIHYRLSVGIPTINRCFMGFFKNALNLKRMYYIYIIYKPYIRLYKSSQIRCFLFMQQLGLS